MTEAADFDIVVVGAGAAGLLAATEAGNRGAKTLLLEKNHKAGVKILASGGSRCNVTSTLPIKELGQWFGKAGGRFLKYGLHEFGPDDTRALLAEEGVETATFPLEKVFPVSGRARDVLDAFLARLARSPAELALSEGLQEIERCDSGFLLTTPRRKIVATRVIITCGGVSFPKTGTTGDGYPWLRKLGHKIVNPRPALVPLVCQDEWIRDLTGIAIEDVVLSAIGEGGKALFSRRRPLLFTHRGLSGPGPMDLSKHLENQNSKRQLQIDWLPKRRLDELNILFREAAKKRQLIANVIPGSFPKRFVTALMAQAQIPEDRASSDLTKAERSALVSTLKMQRILPHGTEGFAKAEVTAGGVELSEVSPKTMESKIVPGLHIAGEILDLDGPIGGFNFQSAFSTGVVAGRAAAAMVVRKAED